MDSGPNTRSTRDSRRDTASVITAGHRIDVKAPRLGR
jgi:hypothetical protein